MKLQNATRGFLQCMILNLTLNLLFVEEFCLDSCAIVFGREVQQGFCKTWLWTDPRKRNSFSCRMELNRTRAWWWVQDNSPCAGVTWQLDDHEGVWLTTDHIVHVDARSPRLKGKTVKRTLWQVDSHIVGFFILLSLHTSTLAGNLQYLTSNSWVSQAGKGGNRNLDGNKLGKLCTHSGPRIQQHDEERCFYLCKGGFVNNAPHMGK